MFRERGCGAPKLDEHDGLLPSLTSTPAPPCTPSPSDGNGERTSLHDIFGVSRAAGAHLPLSLVNFPSLQHIKFRVV